MTDSEIVEEIERTQRIYHDWCLEVFEHNMEEAWLAVDQMSRELRELTRRTRNEADALSRRMTWEGRC